MKTIFTVLLLCMGSVLFSQNNTNNQELQKPPIEEQFENIYKKSYTYKQSKMIKIVIYNDLKKNVLDTLLVQKNSLTEKNNTITNNLTKITELQNKISSLETDLQSAVQNRDQRSFIGIPTSKGTFSLLLTFSFFIIIAFAGFFAYKYFDNISSSKTAINNYNNLQEEFEQHKKSSLRRFQEVNRKLQDELNKQWKKDKNS